MSRFWRTWAACVACAALPLALVAIPAFAQQRDPGDTNRMKEIVRLMEQGQLTLQVATELAEKHTGGRALVARCEIENSATEAPSPVKPLGGPSADVRQAHERRLIYYVDCFAGDRLTTVGVDGLTHKVVDSPTPSKPRGQEKSKPKTDKP